MGGDQSRNTVAASDGGGRALGARSEARQVMARAAAQARRMLKAR